MELERCWGSGVCGQGWLLRKGTDRKLSVFVCFRNGVSAAGGVFYWREAGVSGDEGHGSNI